jgi:hypothetical protein
MSTEESAHRVWDDAGQLNGHVVETYYCVWRHLLSVPETENLRFSASLPHKSGASYPGIIARAQNVNGDMTGVQRNFLAHDGLGKAPVDKRLQKMSLGVLRGSMIRLAEPRDDVPLLIGEGVETTATAMQATGYPGWASAGTSGLKAADLPDNVIDVILLGENDNGKNADAIAKAAPDLKRKGVRVRVAMPLAGFKDHNSMVMEVGVADVAAAYEAVRNTVVDAADFVDPFDDLVERAKTDPGAPLEPETLGRIKELRGRDPAAFMRLIDLLGKAGWRGITELKRLTENRSDGKEEMSPADYLVEIALKSGIELFHSTKRDCFAYIEVNGHRETHRIGTEDFTLWLTQLYFNKTSAAPSETTLKAASATLKATSLFRGQRRPAYKRVANLGDCILIDLGDDRWRVVRIDKDGYKILDKCSVHFVRSDDILPLPEPVPCSDPYILCAFLNIPRPERGDKPDPRLLIGLGWAVGALYGRGPYLILFVLGENGSLKTSTCRLLRGLVDPRVADLIDMSFSVDDLQVEAAGVHVLGFDNITDISDAMSNALCRISSGMAASKRKLYSDADRHVKSATNPIVINSIIDPVRRPDLGERSMFMRLSPMFGKRKPDKDLEQEIAAAAPEMFGLLCGLLSAGFKNREKGLGSGPLPRMADAFQWAGACLHDAFGEGAFAEAYKASTEDVVSSVLRGSPVASALIEEMEGTGAVEMTKTHPDWLRVLSDRAGKRVTSDHAWPRTTRALADELRRAANYLYKVGVGIDFSPRGHGRNRDRMIRVFIFFPNETSKAAFSLSAQSTTAEDVNDGNELRAEKGRHNQEPGRTENRPQFDDPNYFRGLDESPDWVIDP